MKKYLFVCLVIILSLFAADYLYFYNGDYYISNRDEIACFTGADNQNLYIDNGEGPEKFEIKGVNLGLGKPGYFATDKAVTKEEYLRWFSQIQDLGSNVIRIYTVAHPDFYEAFYEYNSDNPEPLYLIQGVWVDDYLLNSVYSAFDIEFYEPFYEECKDVVDIVHGRKKIREKGRIFPVNYKFDVSPWVYAYILGVEWESDIVAFTNESEHQSDQYEGKYLYTEDASNFEIFLAAIGDRTIEYETEKYGAQRALAFANWTTTDPFDYDENIQLAAEKYAKIDVDNILAKDSFEGGMFASYHVYPYYPEYISYEDESDVEDNQYLEYLTRLNKHHNIPVVITEFGVPSSRGKASYEQNRLLGRDQGGMSETGQGEALVSLYKDIKKAGSAGGIVFIWQDEWFKRTWNTMSNVDLSVTAFWSDYQTNEQYFGLLSFDPGKEESICYVDGDRSDWKEDAPVIEKEGYGLYMKYDEKFIYFMVEKEGMDITKDSLYLPIDTTPKSGSLTSSNLKISMTEPADFVVEVNGKDKSRIWVQERYDTATAIYGDKFKRYFNPYVNIPEKESSQFNKINLLLSEFDYYYKGSKIEFRDYSYSDSDSYYSLEQYYETGKLTYGNANPSADDFNSLADFCAGDGFVEIKIPWQLLNFADPTTMRIHDDYYECYGVEYIKIDSMNVGAGDGKTEILMEPFKLKGLGKEPEYHERLKESYYILKDYWASE